MAATRQSKQIFLIGPCQSESLTNLKKLPTNRKVLQRFHEHLKKFKSVRNASHATVDELLVVWSKAAIPTMLKTHAIEKLEKLHNMWLLLKKNRGRKSQSQQMKVMGFGEKLDFLFDIAHAEAMTLISIREDQAFLQDQRGERKMFIGSKDKELAEKLERAEKRCKKEEDRKHKADELLALPSTSSYQASDSDEFDNSSDSTTEDDEYEPAGSNLKSSKMDIPQKKLKTSEFMNSNVVSALDRNKTSDREAVRLMVPVVAALGHDPKALPISRSTIQRARKQSRSELAKNIRDEFDPIYLFIGMAKCFPKYLVEGMLKDYQFFCHHILELILSKVFAVCFGPSSSPEIPLFKRFKAVWQDVVTQNFSCLTPSAELGNFFDSTLTFLTKQSLQEQPRDDYKELIELTLVVLGSPPETIHWRAPGPVHCARWMAKLIYAIKIYLFRHQGALKLTRREEAQIERYVQFGALIYTKAWISAPLAVEAPSLDLQLWNDLQRFQTVDVELSEAAKKVLEHHLWHLSDELVGLALFADSVSSADKLKIVQGMGREAEGRKVRGNPAILKND